ncbi:hypothetical protein KCMC57_64200 (plasmid) [Kitasatospora sp. CMC57]|uniref:Uncharacterized protein n=1 Tax=Kitasatospora sp. CMC57 TaxID=3231513 RepID=A0AB33K381_9ACTN
MTSPANRIQQLRDGAEAVRALHQSVHNVGCALCLRHGDESWPCTTLRALDGETEAMVYQSNIVYGLDVGARAVFRIEDTVESIDKSDDAQRVRLTSGIELVLPVDQYPYTVVEPARGASA